MDKLQAEIQRVSYEILQKTNPQLLESVEKLVKAGQSPQEIVARVERIVGVRLTTLVIEQAAEYIRRNPTQDAETAAKVQQ